MHFGKVNSQNSVRESTEYDRIHWRWIIIYILSAVICLASITFIRSLWVVLPTAVLLLFAWLEYCEQKREIRNEFYEEWTVSERLAQRGWAPPGPLPDGTVLDHFPTEAEGAEQGALVSYNDLTGRYVYLAPRKDLTAEE